MCMMARVGVVPGMLTRFLQARCVLCEGAVLQKETCHCEPLTLASFPFHLVVLSLLLSLGSPVKEVRRAAVQCLQALSGVASKFQLVIEHLVPKAEEITSDATYVVQVDYCQRRLRRRVYGTGAVCSLPVPFRDLGGLIH